MQAAAAKLNPTAAAVQRLMGLQSIQAIKQCHQALSDGQSENLIQQLQAIHQKLLQVPQHHLLVAEDQHSQAQAECISADMSSLFTREIDNSSIVLPKPEKNVIKQAWITNSQVHFCAKVYPTVTMNHPDAAPLLVLGGVLRNGFLHRTIREQGGAYGGGASQDSNSASFRFYSYRDPRMSATLEDFDASITWLLEKNISHAQIEESILSVIGSLDKPGSPAGEAKQAFHARLAGRTDELRTQFRERIINVTAEDLYRVTETYLTADKANIAIVTGKHGEEEARGLGLEIIHL